MEVPTQMRSASLPTPSRQLAGQRLLRGTCAIFFGVIACCPHIPESSAGHRSAASTTDLSTAQAVGQSNSYGETTPEVPRVPELVLKSLASQDPNTRLRSLNYWGSKDTKLPLDPVLEVMEDEHEAVRARAIAIIEQQWAMEQYVMDLTFSMTRSTGDQFITRRP